MKRRMLLTVLLVVTPAHGQLPGRLFFTPDERANIDRNTQPPAPTAKHRLDGYLKPAHGKRTYWINGRITDLSHPELAVGDSSDAPLLPSNSVRIKRNQNKRNKQP